MYIIQGCKWRVGRVGNCPPSFEWLFTPLQYWQLLNADQNFQEFQSALGFSFKILTKYISRKFNNKQLIFIALKHSGRRYCLQT
jgi:hypothetical protein